MSALRTLTLCLGALVLGTTAEAQEWERYHQRVDSLAQAEDVPLLRAKHIYEAALEHRVPTRIAFGLVREESGYRPHVVSHAGAYGLAQVKPSTAREVWPTATPERLLRDESLNVQIAMEYLARLYERFDSWEKALASYNAGAARHARSAETGEYSGMPYARRVLR